MPSLDNNLQVQIQTSANTEGINKTEASIKGLGETTESARGRVADFTKAFVFGNIIFSLTSDIALKVKDAFGAVKEEVEETEKVHAQLNAVLLSTHSAAGMTVQAVDDLASSIAHSTAIDDEAVISAENMLLTFTNIHKEVFPATTKAVTDMATAMNGGATPSAEQLRNTAILVGKALNDPAVGLSRLMRVGVAFTEQQKDQIKTMEAAGNMTGAQTIILNELAKEFGGSATAAAKTWQGQLEQLKNTMVDFSGNAVSKLTPLLGELLVKVIDFSKRTYEFIGSLANWHYWIGVTKAVLLDFKDKALAVVTIAISDLKLAFEKLKPTMVDIKNTFFNDVIPALRKLWEAIGPQLLPIIKDLAIAFGVTLFVAVKAALVILDDLLKIAAPVFQFLADHKWIIDALAIAFISLKAAMMLGAAFDAVKLGVATLQLVTFPSMIGTLTMVTEAWVAAFPIAGILVAIALVANAIRNVIDLHRQMQADISANNASNQAEVANLKAAAVLGKTVQQRTSAKNTLHMLGVPGYATGTNSAPGGVAVVGEQGPEAVVLPRGSQVMTAKQTQRMNNNSGGMTNIFNVYNQVDLQKGISEIGWRLRNA